MVPGEDGSFTKPAFKRISLSIDEATFVKVMSEGNDRFDASIGALIDIHCNTHMSAVESLSSNGSVFLDRDVQKVTSSSSGYSTSPVHLSDVFLAFD